MTEAGILWRRARDSLWFTPGLLTLAAVVLAFGLLRVDAALHAAEWDRWGWLFSGGAEGARGVLTAISGGLITVTGVVFSITVVALQLASTQFTPRVLRHFKSDRASQVTLGVLIGTFTYAVLVLRAVRSEAAADGLFVPAISVTLAVVLGLVSMAFLIFFIDHIADEIRAGSIIHRAAEATLQSIERLFPEQIGEPEDIALPEATPPASAASIVRSVDHGYLQAVDSDKLFELAERHRLVLRMECRPGEFIVEGQPLASIWPPNATDDDRRPDVRKAFVIGHERTMDQDFAFGLSELSDIAVKALSPGINDPTTAAVCIDHLGAVLIRLGGRRFPAPVRYGTDGNLRFIAAPPSFGHSVSVAFEAIRHHGAGHPAICRRLLQTLGRIGVSVPERRRAAIVDHIQRTLEHARAELGPQSERDGIERVGQEALLAVRSAIDDEERGNGRGGGGGRPRARAPGLHGWTGETQPNET